MKKVYLACSLTHAPENFTEKINWLKAELKKHFTLLEFYGLTAGEPKDIYEHDVKSVKNCDLLLAEVSNPALGVGYEIATGLYNHKPVFACAHASATVSRLILRIQHPNFTFFRYNDISEIIQYLTTHT